MATLLVCACGPSVIDPNESDSDTDTATEGPTTQPSTTDPSDSSPSTTDPSDTTPTTDPDTGPDPTGEPGTRAIDILFVVDNSGSMGDAQGRLVQASAGLVAALDELALDWRIGVTTTDNGNPWCATTSPEAGKLALSSCRSRLGEFVFNGAVPSDASEVACTNVCSLEQIDVQPTTTATDPSPDPRPWLEPANLPAGVGAAEALACVLPQGIAGCGFESPLESAYKAMLRNDKEDEAQYDFVRDEALLLVVVVTDEADCSYNNEYQSIFLPADQGGTEVFWSDPSSGSPTSAVCWNAGVTCSGAGPYDECHSTNKSVDGATDVPDSESVLHPISRYTDFFAGLAADKQAYDPGAGVLFAVIGGVPAGYAEGAAEIPYAPSTDPQYQNDFGIGPACAQPSGVAFAVPAVRERQVAEPFAIGGARNLWSVCEPSYDGAIAGITEMIAAQVGG